MARPNPEQKYATYTETYKKNTGTTYGTYSSRDYLRSYSSISDPNFPRKRDWHPFSSYAQFGSRTVSIRLYESFDGRPDLGWGDYQCGFFSAAPSFTNLDAIDHDPDVLYMAKNAHMDAIADRKVNLAQAFAERGQTVRLIADTAKRIASSIHHLRRGNMSLAARSLGVKPRSKITSSIADDWLALQYGWKPLLSDVRGAAELLAQRHYSRPARVVIRTKRSRSYQRSENGLFYQSYKVPGLLEGTCTTRVRLESVYEVSNQFIRDGGQTGVIDPLTLAWELLPWSFVVDWFIPVGNFVARMNYDAGLSFVSGLQSRYSTFVGFAAPQGVYKIWSGQYGTYLTRVSSGRIASNAVRTDRAIVGAVSPDLPKFKDPFSSTHCLNALALMRAQFKRY